MTQTSPTVVVDTLPAYRHTAASTDTQLDVSHKGKIAAVSQYIGRNTSASTAEGDPISNPVAEKHHAGNKIKHHKPKEVRMCMRCVLGLYVKIAL